MQYTLGVDAGNTKTIALVSQLDGRIVGWGRSGCGDIYNAGSPEQALKNIHDAVCQAMQMANCGHQDIASAAFSMAGADWPEDFQLLERALQEGRYAQRLTVVNDAVGHLRAGAPDSWGVAIANGTAAAVSARSKNGALWHSSFWQEGGGASALGQAALTAVCQSELGIIGKTALTERLLSHYQLDTVEELLHGFTRRQGSALGSVGGLARLVLDAAEQGDPIALQIVYRQGTILGDYAAAAARKVGIAHLPFRLILGGGVFKHQSPLLTKAILERVQTQCPRVKKALLSELEPSAGALIIALEATGAALNRKIRARLKASLPDELFFRT